MSTKIKFTVLWQIYFVCVEPPKSWLQVPFRNNTHANMCGVLWYYFSSAYDLQTMKKFFNKHVKRQKIKFQFFTIGSVYI